MELNKYKIRNTISTPATSEFSGTPSKILHQAAFDAYEAYHSNVQKLKKAKANKKSFGKKKRKKRKKEKKQTGGSGEEDTVEKKCSRQRHNRKNKKRRQHKRKQLQNDKFKSKPYCIKFKSSRTTRDSIGFQACGVKLLNECLVSLFPRTMKDPLRISRYDGKADQDPRICRIHGKYYFSFPESIKGDSQHQGQVKEVAIDPGVRKFMAYYSPSGTSGFIGQGAIVEKTIRGTRGFVRKTKDLINKQDGFCGFNSAKYSRTDTRKKVGDGMYRQMDIHFSRYSRIRKDMRDLDEMYSAFSTAEKKITRKWYRRKKYCLKRAWHRLMSKASSRMEDFHWKSAQFLLDNFDTVYIPKFQVQNMTRKGNLTVKTRKRMLYQKHYSFRQKLIYKASVRGKTVIEGSEWGTTKCCGVCGLRNDPRSAEVYSCSGCTVRDVERDLHGARNYYIKEKSRIHDSVERAKRAAVYRLVKTEVVGIIDAVLASTCSGTAITVRE